MAWKVGTLLIMANCPGMFCIISVNIGGDKFHLKSGTDNDISSPYQKLHLCAIMGFGEAALVCFRDAAQGLLTVACAKQKSFWENKNDVMSSFGHLLEQVAYCGNNAASDVPNIKNKSVQVACYILRTMKSTC